MRHIPAIKSVMTPFPYSVDINASLFDARKFMGEHNIRHLPVTDEERLVGIISERDIKAYLGMDFDSSKELQIKVRNVKLEGPYIVDLNERLDIVLQKLSDEHIDAVLVTRNGKLAGVFTMTDACRSFAEYLREQFGPAGGNDAA